MFWLCIEIIFVNHCPHVVVWLQDEIFYIYIYMQRILIHGSAEIWNLFQVFTRISHEWAMRTDVIPCSTREIISFFQTSMYCSVYHIQIALLPHKIRAVSLMRFVIIDTCEIIMNNHASEINFISGLNINKPLYFM